MNLFGACSGGMTLSALLGYLAAARERKVHSATLAVCVLDTAAVRGTTLDQSRFLETFAEVAKNRL